MVNMWLLIEAFLLLFASSSLPLTILFPFSPLTPLFFLFSYNFHISIFTVPSNLPLCWLRLSLCLILSTTAVIVTSISDSFSPSILIYIFLFLHPPYMHLPISISSSFPNLPPISLPLTGIPLAFSLFTPDHLPLQVLLPGWGGHVYGGGPALGRRPALSPPAERPLLGEHCQTLHLWISPGPGIPTQQAHHTQVPSFLSIFFLWTLFCGPLYCHFFNNL